jgi:class 3 adenylate cyclase/Tfp pilus assembly protein PilF
MNVGNYYTENGSYDTALDYFEKSWAVYIQIGDTTGEIGIINNIGNLYRYMADYDKALEYLLKSLEMSEEIGDKKGMAFALNNIGIVYALQDQYDKVLEYFFATLTLSQELGNKRGIAYALNNIGLVYEELKEYNKALEYYERSLKIKRETGNKNGIASSLKNIGNIYHFLGDSEKALANHLQALEINREIGNKSGIIHSLNDISEIQMKAGDSGSAYKNLVDALELAKEIDAKFLIKESYLKLSNLYKTNNNYQKALEYFELYTEVKDSIFSEASTTQIAELQTKYETEKKEAEIKLLKNDKTIADLELGQLRDFRIYITIVLSLVVLLAILLFRAYRLNKKANLYLEERNRLDMEDRARVLNMFGQQVSQEIVDELLTESSETKSKRNFVCIMFLDIRDFTPNMEGREPEEIIAYQNDVFGFMIEIINKNFGIINQFLGDGYMATFGAPLTTGHDCDNALKAALEIVKTANEKSASGTIPETRIGIGLHAGDVVTGNVGTSIRKQYSITGNTVILASRIEKLNKEYNTQLLVSEEVIQNSTYSDFNAENLGEVPVKGREKPINIFKLA